MKGMQVTRPGRELEPVEKEIPEPGDHEVRIKVEACGICHSDLFVLEGSYPGISYPRIPGHEVVGTVDATGGAVEGWRRGRRVGVGWHGGHCFRCSPCRHGDFIHCVNGKVTGISFDGGYAGYMTAPEEALAAVPDELEPTVAAPLLCAGVTTFNALRHSGARPGDLVAVVGIGGLGHLAVQFAHSMGFRTVALSRGADKMDLAEQLGARAYIDSGKENAAEKLQAMGGARAILMTAPSGRAVSGVLDGLGRRGKLMTIGIGAEGFEAKPQQLIKNDRSILGWASGTAMDSEETLAFCALTGIRPMIELFPLERAREALTRMLGNKVRFRAVLTP